MPGRPPLADLLPKVARGDPLSPEEENLLRRLASRAVILPDSISDESGTRQAARIPTLRQPIIEITHIDHTELGFEMKNFGFCLGKYVDFDTEEVWNKKYDESILQYDPDDDDFEDPRDRYIFIGFIDQCSAGVPGQRYLGVEYGTKTASGLTGGDLTLPLVMVQGGTPCTCILAEDHPGCGVVFDVWIAPIWSPEEKSNVGNWDLDAAIWDIEGCDSATVKFKAIDNRVWGLDPLKYATGLFAPRVSKSNGIILEVLELDCESPGGCYFCEAPA